MTTQHTHHEHNDVNQSSVVEYPSASETTTAGSTSPSSEIQSEGSAPSSDTAQTNAEQVGSHANAQSEPDNAMAASTEPSDSGLMMTKPQEPSQNVVHSEIAHLEDAATDTHDMQAIAETSTLNSTVAYEDEILQKEAEATPSIAIDEEQEQHAELSDKQSIEVEAQVPSHMANASDSIPVTFETDKPMAPNVEQEQPTAVVTVQAEPESEVLAHQVEVQDETQTAGTTEAIAAAVQEGNQVEVKTGRDEGEARIEEKVGETETQPAEMTLLTEDIQTSTEVEHVSLPMTTAPVEAQTAQQSEQPFLYTEIAPLINAKAEEVRPFTEFIEEFRLAEAARLQSTTREPQAEAFVVLNSVEEPLREIAVILESVEGTEKIEGTHMQAEANQTANTESKEIPTVEQKAPIDPANRPVSPLLRPATRLRVPRHGLTRHQREEQQASEVALPAAQKAQPETREPDTTPIPTPTSEPATAKPARRYRFDRPSPTAKSTPAIAASTIQGLNGSTPIVAPTVSTKGISTQGEEARINNVVRLEVQVQQETAPETKMAIETTSTTAPTTEQGRRRHIQKEQVVPTPIVEAPAPIPAVIEAVTHADEIAPEDLPPLEYAELQKASNSRRRRRHRSGAPNVPGATPTAASEAPVIPVTPVIPLSPSPLLPQAIEAMPQLPPSLSPMQAPAASYQNAAANNVYNIVSGYTLNQMNQGNEIVGPFMGPEPSPARGSVQSRDGRTTRAESQRTPMISPTPSFSSRATEHTLHGPSTASMTQFANIVSQAIQTQTDRMVAELRRANQAPTNVSVSLPPFPSTERVGVFVDVANLLYSARTLRIAVDFGKLLDFLRGNRRLIRAHAYCPTSPQPGDEQMFLQAVKGLGYRITTKNYKTFSSGAKKADLDLDLCMDVVRLVDGRSVDCVVLVSGDSDFMPMLDYCSDHGVRVEVAAFDEAMSATLRQSCDLFVNLSMLEEIRA